MLIHGLLFGAPWTVAYQAPRPMEFSRQEYWSGLPLPSAGDLPYAGMEPTSLVSPALAGGFFTTSTPWEVLLKYAIKCYSRCATPNVLAPKMFIGNFTIFCTVFYISHLLQLYFGFYN